MKTTMIVMAIAIGLTGCRSVDRLTGTEKKEKDEPQLVLVACCRDNDGAGNMSYPAFLPTPHVQLCEDVRRAPDGQIGGDTYLAMGTDCGRRSHYVGNQYYPPAGY